jgi:hypothetical protein
MEGRRRTSGGNTGIARFWHQKRYRQHRNPARWTSDLRLAPGRSSLPAFSSSGGAAGPAKSIGVGEARPGKRRNSVIRFGSTLARQSFELTHHLVKLENRDARDLRGSGQAGVLERIGETGLEQRSSWLTPPAQDRPRSRLELEPSWARRVLKFVTSGGPTPARARQEKAGPLTRKKQRSHVAQLKLRRKGASSRLCATLRRYR